MLKPMLGFEILYNLPQEVKPAKQPICLLSPSLCSYIKQDYTLAKELHYAIPLSFILFSAENYTKLQFDMHVTCSTKYSDLYLM